jgi:hypothetical protein
MIAAADGRRRSLRARSAFFRPFSHNRRGSGSGTKSGVPSRAGSGRVLDSPADGFERGTIEHIVEKPKRADLPVDVRHATALEPLHYGSRAPCDDRRPRRSLGALAGRIRS